MRRFGWIVLVAALGLTWGTGEGLAEIYKYKDENGVWHFTDTPVDVPAETEVIGEVAGGETVPADLALRLTERFNPQTPVASATLATVTVAGPLGTGSGFFISKEGHILTNRHVIHGDPMRKKETLASMAETEEQIRRIEGQIAGEVAALKKREAELARFESTISEWPRGGAANRAGGALGRGNGEVPDLAEGF